MGWPESVTYLLLVVLGYALTRIVDLAVAWQRNRLRLGTDPEAGSLQSQLSATARQRLMERRAAYTRFRASVNNAVEASVNHGHGNYGLLYQIRDDYGDLLRLAPTGISHAADSVIRCVTLLVNLGPSDQRFAMFTRALNQFDEECATDQGLRSPPNALHPREFSVLGSESPAASELPAPPTENDSASVRAPT